MRKAILVLPLIALAGCNGTRSQHALAEVCQVYENPLAQMGVSLGPRPKKMS